MKKPVLMMYGAIPLFLLFFLLCFGAFWHFDRLHERQESKDTLSLVECVVAGDTQCSDLAFDEKEWRSGFWARFFENMQSEFGQVLSALIFAAEGVFAAWIFYYAKKDQDEILAEVKALRKEMAGAK